MIPGHSTFPAFPALSCLIEQCPRPRHRHTQATWTCPWHTLMTIYYIPIHSFSDQLLAFASRQGCSYPLLLSRPNTIWNMGWATHCVLLFCLFTFSCGLLHGHGQRTKKRQLLLASHLQSSSTCVHRSPLPLLLFFMSFISRATQRKALTSFPFLFF